MPRILEDKEFSEMARAWVFLWQAGWAEGMSEEGKHLGSGQGTNFAIRCNQARGYTFYIVGKYYEDWEPL
jgi:predicted choloylglycine hydrolase